MARLEEAHASFSRAQALAQGHPDPDCQINLKNFSKEFNFHEVTVVLY
jgi:hypothetical protein